MTQLPLVFKAAAGYDGPVYPKSPIHSQASQAAMKFIEMSGKTLLKLVTEDEKHGLEKAGVTEHCLVRINPQGDVEVRQHASWGILGGLLGDFEIRVRKATGLDWAESS